MALRNEGKAHASVLESPQHPRTLPLAGGEKTEAEMWPLLTTQGQTSCFLKYGLVYCAIIGGGTRAALASYLQ